MNALILSNLRNPQIRKGNSHMIKPINPPIQMDGYDIACLKTAEYSNGCLAVQAYTSDDESALTVSVNLPEYSHRLEDGKFFVKTWSENQAPIAKLIENGIIVLQMEPAVPAGYCSAPIAKLA